MIIEYHKHWIQTKPTYLSTESPEFSWQDDRQFCWTALGLLSTFLLHQHWLLIRHWVLQALTRLREEPFRQTGQETIFQHLFHIPLDHLLEHEVWIYRLGRQDRCWDGRCHFETASSEDSEGNRMEMSVLPEILLLQSMFLQVQWSMLPIQRNSLHRLDLQWCLREDWVLTVCTRPSNDEELILPWSSGYNSWFTRWWFDVCVAK